MNQGSLHLRVLPPLLAIGVLLVATSAHAQRPSSAVEYVPANEVPAGVEVREQLGAQAALDTRLIDATTGAELAFRDLLGTRPVLLTFNYSACPGLCSAQLNRLAESLAAGKLVPGTTFRLVTVVLAPDEAPARAARTRGHYLDKLGELGIRPTADGWTFLVARPGDGERGIRALADSVGFGYRKVDGEYAHPATIIALASDGTITRYVHGLELTSADLATTVVKAGLAEPSTATGFVLACFHLAPRSHNALVARSVLRVVAASFVAVLLGIGAFLLARRHRKPSGVTPS